MASAVAATPLLAQPGWRPQARWYEMVRRSGVLSHGLLPLFLTLDVLAWTVAALSLGRVDGLDAGLLLLTVVLLGGANAYRSRLTLSVLEDWPRLAGRVLAAAGVVMALDLLLGDGLAGPRVLYTGLLFAVLLVLGRALAYGLVRSARASGLVSHRTLVLGAGQVGKQVAETLTQHPEYGLRPLGFLDADPLLAPDVLPVPVLGSNEQLASAIVEHGIEDVIVAFGSLKEDQLVEVIRTCDRLDCEIFLVPRLFELHAVSRDMDHIWGIPLVRHHRAAFRTLSWRVKRLLDVTLSALALLALGPLLLALALAVRAEGGPGIIFRQVRVGLDGRPFELLKFRSLRPVDAEESATLWNVSNDGRLGPVGRVLRSSSLDELPQLWNILRGDMSLVGPRPERPHFVTTFGSSLPRYPARHRVPAGLTGWAQVHGLRGDTSIADRARFDNYYIENWSLGLDLRILLRTVVSVLRRSGG